MFGGKSPRERADALFADGDYGSAKLEYERALGGDDNEHAETRIKECLNAIAEARIAEARRLVELGDPELAREELLGALEVADDPEVREAAQDIIDKLEVVEAVEQSQSAEITDEERLALIIGSWSEAQADEYDEYGDTIFDAVLKLNDGEYADAITLFEAILEDAEAPRYLYLDLGRARLGGEDTEGGSEALLEFLECLGDDEVTDARLLARMELARIANEADDFAGAMEQFQNAIDEMESDHRPYLAMGNFLRLSDTPKEAAEVLEVAAAVMSDMNPDWRVMQELGLAYRDAEEPARAIQWLENAIDFFTGKRHLDFPPQVALPLAELHEEHGKLERAADMYRALSQGSDRERHATYYRHAGRVLRALGLEEEAVRMLKRGAAIVTDDEERDAIAALLENG